MAHLPSQFEKALGNIEPGNNNSKDDKPNAQEAHRLVREALKADQTLRDYGLSTILIGSYKRDVSIRRIKDVDVFARLTDLPDDVTAGAILDRFFDVLNAEFGRDDEGVIRTKRQDRSLMVRFPEFDLTVDAVPARPNGDVWEIPKKSGDDEWVLTNPDRLTTLSSDLNSEHNGFYKHTVKLLRQTRRNILLKDKKPGGFFIEIAAYQAFASGSVTGTDHAEYFVSALREVSRIIADFAEYGIAVNDPTLDGQTISIRASQDELEDARNRFADAVVTAEEALAEDDLGQAAVGFRKLFGKDDDGVQIFVMPSGYNEDGTKKAAAVEAGAADIPSGNRNFG